MCALAALAALAFSFAATLVTPVAYARITHTYESVITEAGQGAPLGPANSLAVHSGDLYVGANRTDQFAPSLSRSGEYEFVSQLPESSYGTAFGSAGGETEMYLMQGSGVKVFAAGLCGTLECATFQNTWTGVEVPEETRPFTTLSDIAVDHSTSSGDWASGDVFVADSGEENYAIVKPSAIDIFEPQAGGAEKYVGQVTGLSPGQHFVQGHAIALITAVSGFNGDLLVHDSGTGEGQLEGVYVLRPEEKGKYGIVCQLVPPGGPVVVSSLAVDDGNGEIYVGTSGGVDQYGPECGFHGAIAAVPKEGTPGGVKGQTEEVPLTEPRSLAVDPESHRVFVGKGSYGEEGFVDVFSPDVVIPDMVTEAPSNPVLETDPETGAVSWGVELTGSVNPLNEGEASCGFAWGLTEAFGQEAPCSPSMQSGGSPVPVHASLTGLQPDTDYVYRLHATNNHGTNRGEASETYRFTTPGPALRSESVSEVSSSSVTFEGTITPHDMPNYALKLEGSERAHDLQAPTKTPTSYYFQYNTRGTGVCTAEPSACTSVPSSPASVASATGDVNVTPLPVHGLAANTTYHYRLVAMHEALPESKPGVLSSFYGPDRTFTTQRLGESLVLPDNRAWELVSPADKHGAILSGAAAQAAAGGGEFTFFTGEIPTEANAPSSLSYVRALSSRVAPGLWSSTDISLSRSQPQPVKAGEPHDEYHFFSEDFSLAVAATEGTFSVPEGWHQNEHGEWEHFVEASPVPTEPTSYLRHNTTCSAMPGTCYEPILDSEDVTSGEKYEAAGFVGATPDGTHLFIGSTVQLTKTPIGEVGLYEWSAARPPAQRLSLVNVGPHGEALPQTIEGLAADGSRVVLGQGGDLYVRDAASGEVAQLNLKEDDSQPAEHGTGWVGASADASRVFFLDESRLTADASPQGVDLYVCVLESAPLKCQPRDLTAPASGSGESAGVSGTLGVSSDGSHVYFLASGVLAPGATRGESNLYVAGEREGKWTTTFIASPQPVGEATAVGGEHRVSSSGRWLAFSSHSPLTGYDNRDAKTGLPDSEVYLYDAESSRLVCASCDPTGARPTGESVVPNTQYQHTGLGAGSQALFEAPSRALFDTGRLFFNSGDALVPQDTNSNTDVYEFEPAGVGSCASTSATFNTATGGCVALISSGAPGPSEFLDASSTGSDAFFTTSERLVPQDVDNLVDVYDAHECTTSSPCPRAQAPPPECATSAACLLAPTPPPEIFGSVPTESLVSRGNALPLFMTPPKAAAQLRAERLAKALRVCRKRFPRSRKRRTACERAAHLRFAAKKASRKASIQRQRRNK